MLPARQFNLAAIAALLIAWASFVSFPSRAEAKAPDPSGACAGDTGIAVLASPMAPWRGVPDRVGPAARALRHAEREERRGRQG
jgi:hypothetical protein